MPETLFETSRLIARRLDAGDLEELLLVYGDKDAMRWVDDGGILSRSEGIRWLDVTAMNYRNRGYGMAALVARVSGELIGFCGLVHPGGQAEAEIKYALKRAYWGQGFATEAAEAMLAYGNRHHGLNYIIATTAPDNIASHRVLQKAGMTQGRLVEEEDGGSTLYFEWRSGISSG